MEKEGTPYGLSAKKRKRFQPCQKCCENSSLQLWKRISCKSNEETDFDPQQKRHPGDGKKKIAHFFGKSAKTRGETEVKNRPGKLPEFR